MEYETWFGGNVRVVKADPDGPGNDYANLKLIKDGPPCNPCGRGRSQRA